MQAAAMEFDCDATEQNRTGKEQDGLHTEWDLDRCFPGLRLLASDCE